MSSDEERLENMLKAVMETDDATVSDQNEWAMVDQEKEMSDEIPDGASKAEEEEMLVDPLALLDMSEEEIDVVLEKEAAVGGEISEKEEPGAQEEVTPDVPEIPDDLSDISGDAVNVPDIPEESTDEEIAGEAPFGNIDLDSESVQDLLGLTPDAEQPAEEPDAEPVQEPEPETETEKKTKQKKKKEKRKKKEKKAVADGKEKKESFGKKLAALFFGPDEDELDDIDPEDAEAITEQGQQASEKDAKAKAEKKEKKKKEKAKKKKESKKNEPDPKKAAKEKQQKAKNAEKAKKKAEKAEKAEKERRAAKKLPKKKVIVWVLFCASIGIGILLLNSIGMDTLHLTEARNAFYDKDFETAYKLLNGRELEEEDQMLFRQSSAIMHLKHAKEAYENHLKMEKPVMALEDLLKGVGKYQELQAGYSDLITSELTEEYRSILNILQDKYNLSEEGALEINALEDDYEYSLQLEALVNGEVYLSQTEMEQQEEEAAQAYPDLEDILPEEEEYLNDSGN